MSETPTAKPSINNGQPQGVWVKLHLERQSEQTSTMPEFIQGFLAKETAGSYQLVQLIEYRENDNYEMVPTVIDAHFHVNRTYVWACEVIGDKPPMDAKPYNGEGGLG